jgi:MSHA biogenesis protein MshI
VTRCESYPAEGGLVAALARLRQSGKLNGMCATLLSPNDYQFLSIEAPPLPESVAQAELREAVRWKIKDMVDFPVAAAGVDAIRVPGQPGRPAQALAAAASHAVLKPLIGQFQDAKVRLDKIGLAEIAQRNIAALFETPDRALALLTFSAHGGLLTLTCNGQLHATRRLDTGAVDLAGDKSNYERAVLDIQRSLDNFDRNFTHLSLQRLLVLPVPGADDFVAHLRDNLYQPVEALVASDGLDIDAAPMLSNAATLSDALPAIGLALDRSNAADINLFDPALQRQNDPWSALNLKRGLAASVLLCALGSGWGYWQKSTTSASLSTLQPQLQEARNEAQQLRQKIASYRPDANLEAELNDARLRLESRAEVLALLKKGLSPENGNPVEWLSGFARQVPNGLWLTGFNINAETGALEIRGRTVDPGLVPEYLRRLNAEPAFRGHTFAALKITSGEQGKTGNTTLASAPAQAGAPPAGAPAQAATIPSDKPASAGRGFHEFVLTSTQLETGGRS